MSNDTLGMSNGNRTIGLRAKLNDYGRMCEVALLVYEGDNPVGYGSITWRPLQECHPVPADGVAIVTYASLDALLKDIAAHGVRSHEQAALKRIETTLELLLAVTTGAFNQEGEK